jgi:hypothetical protein
MCVSFMDLLEELDVGDPFLVIGNDSRGQPQGSPNNQGETHLFANNKTQTYSQIIKCTPAQSRCGDRGSPRPRQPQQPIKWSALAPLGQISTSLEGLGAVPPKLCLARGLDAPRAKLRLARGLDAPRAKLRLARGLDAPSGETPPRSRAGRPLRRNSALLEGWMPPRAKHHLTRGRPGLVAPVPTPPMGELNALTM